MSYVFRAIKWIAILFVVAIFVLVFMGPLGWIKLGLLVECKYVKSCAKEHNIEYVERKK